MESRIQDCLGVRSFGMIQISISDPRSWHIKWTDDPTLDKDSSVHLIYHDPSDLGSLILIRIIPKERTFGFHYVGRKIAQFYGRFHSCDELLIM